MAAFYPEPKTRWPVAKSNIFTLWAIMVTDDKNFRQYSSQIVDNNPITKAKSFSLVNSVLFKN